jgi:MYXO-CTERM domain-containing protein
VPRDLLVAIAAVEGGLEMPRIREGLPPNAELPAAGPLMLRRGKLDTLARGAALSGASENDLRRDADLALSAGARVLAELGDKHRANDTDLASWSAALAEMSGYADDAHANEYVHRIYAVLARGGRFAARDGEMVTLPSHDLPPSLTIDLSQTVHTLAGAQYPGAQYFPTSCANTKCDSSRATISYIVVHDTEGGWDASVATLQNDPGKSVHYIVNTDGKVGQFVQENMTAYHAGNYFYNQRSVGIEHVGYSTKPYPEAQYASSAKLVDYLAKKYSVTRDRAHIIGHDQIPNGNAIGESAAACALSPKQCEASSNWGGADNHHDPGVWEWATFMVRIGGAAKCDDVTTLWNCNADKNQAFRCNAAGKVEVQVCDGPGACQVKPTGMDDVCNVAPKSTAPPTSTGTGTTAPPGAPPVGDQPAPPPGESHTLPPSGEPPPSASAGCAASPRGPGGAPTEFVALLALALAMLVRRRAS